MAKIKFSATLEQHHGMDAGFIRFPYDVEKHFGSNGRIKVKVLFDNRILYRGSLVKMGYNFHMVGITKEIRKELNKSFGDIVTVEIEKDEDVRVVIVPDDVSVLLIRNTAAKAYYENLSYTNKKENIRWIESAKKKETRLARIETFMNNMIAGSKEK